MHTGRQWPIATAALAVVLAGCGGGGSAVDDIVLDSLPATTTTIRTTTTTTLAAGAAPGATLPPVGTTEPPFPVGTEWEPVAGNLAGLESVCGNVTVASQPRGDLFLAGIANHGLWSVTPGTSDWTAVGAGGDPVENIMTQLLVDPTSPDTYWETGIYGTSGIYRTDDRGASFDAVGEVTHLDHLSIDFGDPERQTMLAGGHESGLLWLSADGGDTWRDVGVDMPEGAGSTSSPHVVDASTFLVGTYLADGSGIFRTTDGGDTWTKVHDGAVIGTPVARDGTVIWLLQNGGGVVSSSDGGATWVPHPSSAIATYATYLVDMPDGSLVTHSADHVIRSSDGGATWRDVGPPLPYEPTAVAYAAGEQAFYVARFDCGTPEDNIVKADSILRLPAASP